ncbi:MAG: sensor histidine kinase [Cyanobacteria bacterium Co-bin8]|nr:sensor histidine kinase [Cyanobacteria bacterium Co-bin8]
MHRRWLFPNHSFRLMLYLEWILLGIMLLGEIRPTPHAVTGKWGLLSSVLILASFGLMGLKLPRENSLSKVLYTAAEFGLLFLAFELNRRTAFFPLLGLIIVMRSCLIFPQAGRLTVAVGVFGAFLLMLFQPMPMAPPPPRRLPPPELLTQTIFTLKLNTAVTFGLTLLFTLLLINTLLSERQSREKLLQANVQLRQYALRIEDQATLQERNRIAREIHDALGHTLTAQSIQLENAQLFLPTDAGKTAAFLQEAQRLGARALQEVRRSVSMLRADPLRGQSLEDAIASSLKEFQQTTGIAPAYTLALTRPLPAEFRAAFYRILQESLTNIYRHSQADQVSIQLLEQGEIVQLQINDNGQGFDPEGNSTGFGLQGMRERTLALGGQFQLFSQPGQGCQITVRLPLPGIVL